MDSGAFTRITTGKGHLPREEYARLIRRWSTCGSLGAAVCQDWMCESFVLEKTGLSIADHQRLTMESYVYLRKAVPETYVMPVLQGYRPEEYRKHVEMYGTLLEEGAWCGIGSVCKRNSNVNQVFSCLQAVKKVRPDLRLHGFGLKLTALKCGPVRELLYSSDSMAWSLNARLHGRDNHHVREPLRFTEKVYRILRMRKGFLW